MTARWLWVSRQEYLEDRDWSPGDEVRWSCAMDTRAGDKVMMYEAGAKRFLWQGTALTDAERHGRWRSMCDVRVDRIFDPPIDLAELTRSKQFKNWGVYKAHFQLRAYSVPAEIWTMFGASKRRRTRDKVQTARRDETQEEFAEGFEREITTNKRERNRALVARAKNHYGTTCFACGFNFHDKFGDHGDGFVEIHHKVPVAKMKKGTTSLADVVPVCANCHRMLHRGKQILSVRKLKGIIARAAK